MKLQPQPPVHLTYCLNIHPGETWPENLAAIRQHALRVRDALCPGQPFGLGLRLGARAAQALSEPATLARFAEFLHSETLYVFTVNGFPYGPFHGRPVKEAVYQPDWRTPERRDYTILLARILSALLPAATTGSISTLPGSYKSWILSPADRDLMSRHLLHCATELDRLRDQTGREIVLALEPEPDCFLETTEDCIQFFDALRAGLSADEEQRLRRHLGVCLDTCHAAMQFEDPLTALIRLHQSGIRVPKIQLSAALATRNVAQAGARLTGFVDPVYLHQTRFRDPAGSVRRYPDLTRLVIEELLQAGDGELRIHFHVPLDFTQDGTLGSTAELLPREFFLRTPDLGNPHLEIETYSFAALPEQDRQRTVEENIAAEYRWVLARATRA